MMQLPEGCYCSDPIIFPLNCNSTAINWQVQCWFHDPKCLDTHPKGKLVVVKGMNKYKDFKMRMEASKIIKQALIEKLRDRGYNPITGQYMIEPEQKDYEIDPNTPMTVAMEEARKKIVERTEKLKDNPNVKKLEPATLGNIKCALKAFTKSSKQLRMDDIPIKDVKRRHIVRIIENCKKSPDRENKIKAYLSTLFKTLVKLEAIESNPTLEIEKNHIIPIERKGFTEEQRKILDRELVNDHYELWRLMHIFYHSGGRKTEFCSIKGKDVFLEHQRYRSLIKKGGLWIKVTKIIKDAAMHYWEDLMKNCKPDDYIIGQGLKPGPIATNPDYINKLWKKIVKDNEEKYAGIDVDFYE